MNEDDFPTELSSLLFDFAERIFESFPPNRDQPRNLHTSYLECVLYLIARMDLLLQYLDIAEAEKEKVIRVVLVQIEEEFGTANATTIAEVVSERMAQYERLFASHEAFTEQWYDRVFTTFAACIDDALDDSRRFVWCLSCEPTGSRPLSRDEIFEVIRRCEIEHVVTFQRVIINFFTTPGE